MTKLLAFAAAMAVCAVPALAQAERPDRDCGGEPETTGALPAGPHVASRPRTGGDRVEVTPPEESWQEAFRDEAERRRQDALACGVD